MTSASIPIRRIILGIDPGVHGGLAALDVSGEAIAVCPMPAILGKRPEVDAPAVASWFYAIEAEHGPLALAVVEQVHAMPGQGVCSSFAFGASYGRVLGVLAALKVSVELVAPQRWKADVLTGTTKDKPAAIAFCRRRWPDVQLVPPGKRVSHDGLADALCLAELGRRLLLGRESRTASWA